MRSSIRHLVLCACLGTASMVAQASGLGDTLRGATGGGASPSTLGGMLGGGTAPSAGVITYCMKNNYLNADKAALVKQQLLGKMGLGAAQPEPRDEGYLSGLSGMVSGSNGKQFNLNRLKGDLKEKACDFVLDNASSLL